MANTRTLAELRAEVLELGDFELDAFITETKVNEQINRSVEQLYDMIVEQAPQFGRVFAIVQTVANVDTIDFDPEHYQLLGVDWKHQNRFRPMSPVDFARRNDAQENNWGIYSDPRYQELSGSRLQFFPTPQSVFDVRVWYIENPPVLVDDVDELDFPGGWCGWVVYDAVQFFKTKAEDEITEVVMKKNELAERILRAARKRGRTGMRTRDVRGRRLGAYRDEWGWWP